MAQYCNRIYDILAVLSINMIISLTTCERQTLQDSGRRAEYDQVKLSCYNLYPSFPLTCDYFFI